MLTEEMQKNQSNELLTVDEFTPYLRKELLLAGLDVAKFDRSLAKARIEADNLTKKYEDQNRESFRLLREYLNAEQAEAKEQEKMIDRMKKGQDLLSLSDLPFVSFVSDTPSVSESALSRFTKYQDSRLASNGSPARDDLADTMTSL
jgi:hypothetical protein